MACLPGHVPTVKSVVLRQDASPHGSSSAPRAGPDCPSSCGGLIFFKPIVIQFLQINLVVEHLEVEVLAGRVEAPRPGHVTAVQPVVFRLPLLHVTPLKGILR